MLEKKEYTQFGETIYSEELDNGLKVKLLSKKSFHKVYGIMSTNYGSADNEFVPYGKKDMKVYPAGIAHFLEHKLFEKKDYDAFELFGKYGADSNAFTSFTRTSYLFSATQNIEKCVEILLDFVQEPYFSEESVKKEQGIIGQEIKMYDDDSGWQLYFGLIWYNENIIDDSFGYDFQFERGFNFAMISGSTSKPEEFKKKIEDLIVQAPDLLEDRAEEFELSKKEFLGSIIRSMNSLESIANRYEGRLYDDATIFDMVEILEKITLEDVVKTAEEFLNQDAISIYELLPESRWK